MNKLEGLYYLYKGKLRTRISKKIGQEKFGNKIKRYVDKEMLSAEQANQYISDAILSGKPFMTCRFGSTELTSLSSFYFQKENEYQKAMEHVCFYSGFFPCEKDLGPKFMNTMLESSRQADMMAVWFVQYEDYFLKKNLKKDAKISYLMNIEPWRVKNPWTKSLKGKKVLVIHPFEESIQFQYNKRELLFSNPDFLPEFELKTLKAIQTIAGAKDARFETWFDALEYMYEEAMKIDFDIAILGCGAYGMPLAAMLKKAGKQAIHLGGVTQILFGIKGKRWEETNVYNYIKELMNDEWVYPLENEKPKLANNVEQSCYWN
ncbi:hypothetical protein [Priestia sp. YIM B13489]|uniref:GT-D fold domain-containing protein n=1 Tax=Priestia sp. YIM B13489 TaxID=3366313 RepID=UPI00366AD03C